VDEQLKSKLIGYLDSLESRLKTGADFVSDETPKLVEEWLRWMAIESGIYAACFLISSLTAFALCRWGSSRLWKEHEKHGGDYSEYCRLWSSFVLAISWVVLPLVNIGTVYHGLHVAKVLTAPRVVVVEKIAELTGLSKQGQ